MSKGQTSSAVLRRNRFESQLICGTLELSTEKLSKTEETTRHVLAKKRTENPVKYYEQFRRSETTIIVPSWTPPVWAIVSGKAGWLQKNGEVANDIKILTHSHKYYVKLSGEKSGRS